MNNLVNIIDPTSPVFISLPIVFAVFKTLFLVAFAIYIVYALVIIRQLGLMSRSVMTRLEWLLRILGIVHFVLSLALWLMALVA